MKTKVDNTLWLGKRCPVCGQPHHRVKYCSNSCQEQANRERARTRYHENKKLEKAKGLAPQRQTSSGAALRIATIKGQQQDHLGCSSSAAGQPSVSDVGFSSSTPPFSEKKTRPGGLPMFCRKYGQIITGKICDKRQMRRLGGAFVDIYCRYTCIGKELRPATKGEINQHRVLVRRIAREKGLKEMRA